MSGHDAEAAKAGYDFQDERGLLVLALSEEGERVGVETGDDVVWEHSDGSAIQEQLKHSLEPGNPWSDRSVSLWKTLAIWVEQVGYSPTSTELFRFRMVTNRPVPDCLARTIDAAESDNDARACVAALRLAGRDPSVSIAPYVQAVLARTDTFLIALVKRINLVDGSGPTVGDDIRAQIAAALHIPKGVNREHVIDSLYGWYRRVLLQQWRRGEQGWITREALTEQFHSVLAEMIRARVAARPAHQLLVSDADRALHRSRCFAFQVEIIECDEEEILESIDNFVRCERELMRLSEAGNLTESDLKAFFDRLIASWRTTKRLMGRTDDTKEQRGYRLFYESMRVRERLGNHVYDEPYISAGAFHRLADELEIGWHPEYKELCAAFRRPT